MDATDDPPLVTAAGQLPGLPDVVVGHASAAGDGWRTGCSVVLPPPGTVGAVVVGGGGPGTRETDALAPGTLVSTVDAVVLSGGSAYGLATADGVMAWCEQDGRGFVVSPSGTEPPLRVPIVPAAVVFDLARGGDPAARPDRRFGFEAAAAAGAAAELTGGPGPVPEGRVGAGTGALVAAGRLPGGVGAAGAALAGGTRVAALVVANAAGVPTVHEATAPDRTGPDGTVPDGTVPPAPGLLNTTLVVVVTDASLDVAAATRLAAAAHAGLARAVQPSHTLVDGDVVFALATGTAPAPVDVPARVALEDAAARTVTEAFGRAVTTAAGTVGGTDPAAAGGTMDR